MIENEYTRQEDYYKQQIADLEEEKEQLQVSNVVVTILKFKCLCNSFHPSKNIPLFIYFFTERINVKSGGKQACLIVLGRRYERNQRAQKPGMEIRC